MSAARVIDVARLKRVLTRVLAPALVESVIDEASVDEKPARVAPTKAAIEAEIRRQDERDKLRGR